MAISEINAIGKVDTALASLDKDARKRVLEWACKKYATESLPIDESTASKKPKKRKEKSFGKKRSRTKAKLSLAITKDLNLRPKGKKTFVDFVNEKRPTSHEQKCTVAAYYLEKILGLKDIGVNHIYTCYKDAKIGWRVPTDLRNKLSYTASQKGWLDTSNMENITLTTPGENLVEHDLPSKPPTQKK